MCNVMRFFGTMTVNVGYIVYLCELSNHLIHFTMYGFQNLDENDGMMPRVIINITANTVHVWPNANNVSVESDDGTLTKFAIDKPARPKDKPVQPKDKPEAPKDKPEAQQPDKPENQPPGNPAAVVLADLMPAAPTDLMPAAIAHLGKYITDERVLNSYLSRFYDCRRPKDMALVVVDMVGDDAVKVDSKTIVSASFLSGLIPLSPRAGAKVSNLRYHVNEVWTKFKKTLPPHVRKS